MRDNPFEYSCELNVDCHTHKNNISHQNCQRYIGPFHYTFCCTKLKLYLYLFDINGRDTNFKISIQIKSLY